MAFKPEESGEAYLCLCKHTANPPYCDGSHARLGADEAEDKLALAAAPSTGPSVAPTPEEPTVKFIHDLARDRLSKTGHHGPVGAMGVPGPTLPKWDDIQTSWRASTELRRDVVSRRPTYGRLIHDRYELHREP
ncbi:MAG: CDGSH iron-sulfur domain-containing protein [Verrucomicrobiia bacterium]